MKYNTHLPVLYRITLMFIDTHFSFNVTKWQAKWHTLLYTQVKRLLLHISIKNADGYTLNTIASHINNTNAKDEFFVNGKRWRLYEACFYSHLAPAL